MDLELRGKKVLITGASKGIGLACAHGFAAEGAHVHLAARSEGLLKDAADAIRKKHDVEVTFHAVDLGVTENVVKLGQACGDVDVLVNNAGAIPQGSLTQLSDERWRKGWELKVFGFFNLTREVYKRMIERGSGAIVNIIGSAGENHRSNYIAGTTGNASLIAFTRALGGESVDHGVRVVGINPGRILTERQIEHMEDQAERELGDRKRWKEILAKTSEKLPFKRTGKPEEVSDLACYLASARAGYISGTVVSIDGGASTRPRRERGRARDALHLQLARPADVDFVPRDHAPRELEQDDRRRLLTLHIDDGVGVDEDERQARIVRAAVAHFVDLAEPRSPVGLIELPDARAIGADGGGAAHRNPLPASCVEVCEIHVRIVLELVELVRLDVGYEPQVGDRIAFLRGHRARYQPPVGTPRRQHRGLDLLDKAV